MPHKTGRGTYKGYESPNTEGWPEPIRNEVRRVYGAWREKHPGENPSTKSRGARIAWFTAKRKYPSLYSQHMTRKRQLACETRKELKEHPWAGKKTAGRIAGDHIKEHSSSLHGCVPLEKKKGKRREYEFGIDINSERMSGF